jgi:hypothetical protein
VIPPTDAKTDDEQRALALLRELSDAIVAGVARETPGWVQRSVVAILDAWNRAAPDVRAQAEQAAIDAGQAAATRVVGELRALFAVEPEEQRATPLEVVRSAYREPTEVLVAAGVAPVERDEYAERFWPEDSYGLVVHGLGDLGDDDLGPLQLAWGLAKAKVLRARSDRG